MKKNRKGLFLGLVATLMIITSFAYFSDYVLDKEDGTVGTFGITATLEADAGNKVLQPGDTNTYTLKVASTGSTNAIVRKTYVLIVKDAGGSVVGKSNLVVNAAPDVALAHNTPVVGADVTLNSGASLDDETITVELPKAAGNANQGLQYTLEVLVEARQASNGSAWEAIDKINVNLNGANHKAVTDK